jgi:diguanylate cyclase (GGDEF)-like protein/PAS domain S-box-containing protein
MSTTPPPGAQPFTASDVLAPSFWSGTPARPVPGLDVACTKIAVDFQNLTRDSADRYLNSGMELLRDAASADAAFVLMLDAGGTLFETVTMAGGGFAQCRPENLKGETLARLPWLAARNDHLRLSDFRDTADPRPEQAQDASMLALLGAGSALFVSMHIRDRHAGYIGLAFGLPRGEFDVNLQLLMKLLGSSLATGLERVRLNLDFHKLEERHRLSEQLANDGVWDFDVHGGRAYFSPRWRQMLGYEPEDVTPTFEWKSLIHPDDMVRVQIGIREHVAGKTPFFESAHRMRHRDGQWRWMRCRAQAVTDEFGRLLRLIGVEADITDQRQYEEMLFREKESAHITLQSIGDGVVTTDAVSIIDYINPVAEQLTGWRMEDAIGRPVEDVIRVFHEETCEPVENPLSYSVRRGRLNKSVRPSLLIARDGNELYVESTAAPIKDDTGKVIGGVLVFHDVSEARELNRKLSFHASHDQLTGLVNRGEFENRIERALKSVKARETAYALCHLDVDQFKIINDSCGHGAGDVLLGQMGALLKSKVRWRDTLSRLGGDEFGVLLESCSLDEAMRMAEVLREAVSNFRFTWEERVFRLSASVGVVPLRAENDDAASVISAAESACAAAKEQGRDRVHSFAENDVELMRRRREMQWAARINSALEDGRFELYRMAIASLQKPETGEHYELLLRMRDENGKIISPDNFLGAAERYNLMPNIDRWVIENAFRWLVSEADERERLSMCAINLSGQSLSDDKFLPYVIEQFRKSGIDANKICFEITETAAVASFSQANRFIQALKELGCKFSLDDFGTGLSSFGYLKHFPVDYLKIDGSFVREILRDPIDREMVRSINEIGHLTGKLTIAEFAENAEIIAMLKSIGVDFAQGYGVSMPQRVLKGDIAGANGSGG